jgi:hypothetical protein
MDGGDDFKLDSDVRVPASCYAVLEGQKLSSCAWDRIMMSVPLNQLKPSEMGGPDII